MFDNYWENAPERWRLPQIYHEVAEILGWDKAVQIGLRVWDNKRPPSSLKTAGGVGCLYVPKSLEVSGNSSVILDLLEYEDATKLVEEFSGQIIFFGNIESASVPRRNDAIRKEIAEGARAEVVACRFGLTARQVRRICNTATIQKAA